MPRVNNNEEESLEGSPLLMNMDSKIDNPLASSRKSRFHSTISPEKFDMTRFTARAQEEEGESSFRIILYVVAVIVVGVGLALFVKFFITKGEDSGNKTETDTQNTATNNQTTTAPEEAVKISIAPKADSTAVTSTVPYGESEQVSLGLPAANATGTSAATVDYSRYNTFSQLVLGLKGLTNNEVPTMVATFNKSTDVLTLKLPAATTVVEDLKAEININDIITSVKYDVASNSLNVKFREDSSYKIFLSEAKVVLEVKTAAQIAKETGTTTPTTATTTTPTTTTETTKPTTTIYDNPFSQNKQFLSTTVNTKSIGYNEIYYTDFGDSFELAFGMKNSVGESFIPNANVELLNINGVNYLDLTIENLTGIQFTSDNVIDQSDAPIPLATANFVRADLKSFDPGTGIAKIRIQLRNAADFRLFTEKTLSGKTQVLAIIIKD